MNEFLTMAVKGLPGSGLSLDSRWDPSLLDLFSPATLHLLGSQGCPLLTFSFPTYFLLIYSTPLSLSNMLATPTHTSDLPISSFWGKALHLSIECWHPLPQFLCRSLNSCTVAVGDGRAFKVTRKINEVIRWGLKPFGLVSYKKRRRALGLYTHTREKNHERTQLRKGRLQPRERGSGEAKPNTLIMDSWPPDRGKN